LIIFVPDLPVRDKITMTKLHHIAFTLISKWFGIPNLLQGQYDTDRSNLGPPKLLRVKHKRRKRSAIAAGLLALLFYSCANVMPPSGGPRDEQPPQVVPEESTENFQTQFEKQVIEITFDEWVSLNDVFTQVVVSPPLEFRPEIEIRGKTLRFAFDEREELRPDATYTINFGEAVQDLTERNPAENLRFVFSTGDRLDSLSLNGTIVDARTAEPVEEVLFMLYENTADSDVRSLRPFYFARTGKEGNFTIENIKPGIFKGFALKDANLNYRYDQPGEAIGFPDSLLPIRPGLETGPLQIRLFTERPPLVIVERSQPRYGLFKAAFNQEVSGLRVIRPQIPGRQTHHLEKDTLFYWYEFDTPSPASLILARDTSFADTLEIEPAASRAEFTRSARLQPRRPAGRSARPQHPLRPLEFSFNHPVWKTDTSRIELLFDTIRSPVAYRLRIDTIDRRLILIEHDWQEGRPYRLQMLPGAVEDIYGLQNDSISRDYNAKLRKDYGNINLTVNGLDSTRQYVIQLLAGETSPVGTSIVSGSSSFSRVYRGLSPGSYTLRIVTDLNQNGRWDTGRYDTYRQPEPIFIQSLENLRANWDLEAEVNL
ncbi:MAG: Ig-like domain-containing protein, partial [Saprospiraceae bacterium]|nr:Ig-like domain-containing protein [Saprospiraceae bacterium]